MKLLWALCVLLGLTLAEEWVTYEGYRVVELQPQTKQAVEFLRNVQDSPDLLFEGHITLGLRPLQIAIAPSMWDEMNLWFRLLNIDYTLIHHNLGEFVENEHQRLTRHGRAYDLNDFNTLDDIMGRLDYIEAQCASGLTCELSDAGTSYDGRPIPVMRLSSGSGRQAVYVDGTTHAREWLATTTAMRILEFMATSYGSDSEVTSLIDSFDWYFIPMVNPDGYLFTWTNNRYWRKNRAPVGSGCTGVDLNRNFDYNLWGNEGVSHNPCSDLYCGPSGGSEPETQAVQNEVTRIHNAQTMVALVTFHSYGRMWMHPWGHTVNHAGFQCVRADDHDDMFAVAQSAAQAVMAVGGQTWTYGTSCEVIYATTGATDDWAKAVPGVKYPFNPELRGSDFVISPTQIQIAFEESFAGLVGMVDEINSRAK